MRGAGGTDGGIGQFFIGLIMLVAGTYLFLNAVQINTGGFGFGMGLFRMGGFNVTGGMVFVPFIFGIGIMFYNARNPLGWLLTCASLVMLAVGIITNLRLHLRPMTAFELMTMIVLAVGGLGLLLNSLRSFEARQ